MLFSREDFIGIFDNVLDQQECQSLIQYYEDLKNLNLVFNRQQVNDGKRHEKSDSTAFLLETNVLSLTKNNPVVISFLDKFWNCYRQYAEYFSVLLDSEVHGINNMRLQKTRPGEGYHNWHYESSDTNSCKRIIAWSVYLNDIDTGGETEFLYLNKRIPAKQGRVLIWPAAFTHTHRGNPPLNSDKYLLTGWLEFMGKP
jgi:hypothetical protein